MREHNAFFQPIRTKAKRNDALADDSFPRLAQVTKAFSLDKRHRLPVFDPGYNLHAFDNSDKVFRVSQRLQDSPRLTSVASFPALENGHIFTRLAIYDDI